MSKQIITRHHGIPRYHGGTNHIDNIIKLKENKHRALHTLLDDGGLPRMPIEQLSELFRIVSSPLTNEIKYEINKILELAGNIGYEAYNSNCYNIK